MKSNLLHQIYLAGYSGKIMPRWLRKMLAGSDLHRAWFLGFNGYFQENSVSYGLGNPSTGSGGFLDLA